MDKPPKRPGLPASVIKDPALAWILVQTRMCNTNVNYDDADNPSLFFYEVIVSHLASHVPGCKSLREAFDRPPPVWLREVEVPVYYNTANVDFNTISFALQSILRKAEAVVSKQTQISVSYANI